MYQLARGNQLQQILNTMSATDQVVGALQQPESMSKLCLWNISPRMCTLPITVYPIYFSRLSNYSTMQRCHMIRSIVLVHIFIYFILENIQVRRRRNRFCLSIQNSYVMLSINKHLRVAQVSVGPACVDASSAVACRRTSDC